MTDANAPAPDADAARAGADVERTAHAAAGEPHHPRAEDKRNLEALRTTDPANQNADTFMDPTNS